MERIRHRSCRVLARGRLQLCQRTQQPDPGPWIAHRLEKKVDHAQSHDLLHLVRVVLTAEHDYLELLEARRLPDPAERVLPAHDRHHEVQEKQIERLLAK